MARTIIGVNDARTVKRYSAFLAVEAIHKSYFLRKYMGKYQKDGSNKPLTLITDLEKAAGDSITYDLVMRLAGEGVEGDNTLKGNEEKLVLYTDTLLIDQLRHGVDTGGKMTKKRTVHNLRNVARERLAGWWAEIYDENIFAYLSGARGVDTTWTLGTAWTGRAGNSFTVPDSDHQMFAGKKTKATITSSDISTLAEIDRFVAQAETLDPMIQPVEVEGGKHFIHLIHPWQKYDIRTNTTTGQWLDIQKAAATAQGSKNPIFQGAVGIYNDVVIQVHRKVVRFSDYGSTLDQLAARSLFLGGQSGAIAFGSPGEGLRHSWHEELEDRGNVLVVDAGAIFGVTECTFNEKRFGMIALDSFIADPNA